MEITWLGYSCFKIRGSHINVITDPYPPTLGYKLGNLTAEVVTVSHPHAGHSYVEGVPDAKKIAGPGEYEISDVLITGVASYHDAEQGKSKGKNTIYVIEVDDIDICHLGDLGHTLTAAQVGEIGHVDILLIPVGGGGNTLNAAKASEVVRQLEPKIVIPMHYKTPELSGTLEPVDKFLNEMGVKQAEPRPKLTITKSSIPEILQVVVLSC